MIVVLGEASNHQHVDPCCCFSLPLTLTLSGSHRSEAQKSTRSARLFNEAGSQSQSCAGVSAPAPPCFPLRWEGRIALFSQLHKAKICWTVFSLGPVWPRRSLCQPSVWDGCGQEQGSEGGWCLCPQELWWTGRSHQVTTNFFYYIDWVQSGTHFFFSDYLIVFFKNDKFYLFTPFACVDLYMRILFPKGSFNQLKKCLLPPSPWIILGPEWVCLDLGLDLGLWL